MRLASIVEAFELDAHVVGDFLELLQFWPARSPSRPTSQLRLLSSSISSFERFQHGQRAGLQCIDMRLKFLGELLQREVRLACCSSHDLTASVCPVLVDLLLQSAAICADCGPRCRDLPPPADCLLIVPCIWRVSSAALLQHCHPADPAPAPRRPAPRRMCGSSSCCFMIAKSVCIWIHLAFQFGLLLLQRRRFRAAADRSRHRAGRCLRLARFLGDVQIHLPILRSISSLRSSRLRGQQVAQCQLARLLLVNPLLLRRPWRPHRPTAPDLRSAHRRRARC